MPTIEINDVESISLNPNYLVIDMRNKERYAGITEPIDLVAGDIPGPVNIPFTENLNNNGLSLKPSELKTKHLWKN